MKTVLFVFLFLSSLACSADEFNFAWRDQDTARALVLVLEHAVDANQTKRISAMQPRTVCSALESSVGHSNQTPVYGRSFTLSGATQTCTQIMPLHEENAMIGQHASNTKINAYFMALSVLELLIAAELPQGYRDVFQYVRIVDTGVTLNNNRRLGLGFSVGF